MQHLLQTYYSDYAFSEARSQDFLALAEEVSGRRLGAFFISWLYRVEVPAVAQNFAEPQSLESLLAQIRSINGEDWCRLWAAAVIEGDEALLKELAGVSWNQAVPLPVESELKSFKGYDYSVALGSGYQVADIIFYLKVSSSNEVQDAMLSHKVKLRPDGNALVAEDFRTDFRLVEDSLPETLLRRFSSIGFYLRQQTVDLMLPLIHPDKRDELRLRLTRDVSWDKAGWEEVVLGQNREIDAENRIISYQLKVLYTKEKQTEIAFLTWQFEVEKYQGKWYISNYQFFKH